MLVTSFVYCDHIEIKEVPAPKNQIFSLVDPLQMIALYSIPGKISFSISIGLQGEEFSQRDNSFYIEFKDPDGEIVLRTEPIVIQQNVKSNLPSENHGVILNLDVRNFLFVKGGIFKAYLNTSGGKELGVFPILVTKENG